MKFTLFLLLFITSVAGAATIAVIDSGVDVEHRDFRGKIWINAKEIADNGRDEDGNGYQDDVYGWNFAEDNNLVIDRKYLGTFSQDPYKFFEVQARMFMGEATEADKEWLEAKRQEPTFLAEMQKFGNFVHGTHVAGIAQNESPDAKILAIKLIPTEIKPFAEDERRLFAGMGLDFVRSVPKDFRMTLLKGALDKLAQEQMKVLEEIAHYVGKQEAQVANGSFGTGFKQAKIITDTLFKIFFFRSPKEKESMEVASYFLNSLVENGKKMVASAKDTLFVFAAGNDGSNNDVYPTSPTNIEADNVISVAATYKYRLLAPFSNYGVKKVDVAAPGMLIHSQIPGDEYLKVSGTSQAAPFVANVAGRVMDLNPKLTPKQVKEILMGTIDKKDFLVGKIKTAGIVNPKRAESAAELSRKMTVAEAIALSAERVEDVDSSLKDGELLIDPAAVEPMAMPSLFR